MVSEPEVVKGTPLESTDPDYQDINRTTIGPEVTIPMVEVDQISTEGWLCLIMGCFLCPGFNLFGLCMRETVLVPAYNVEFVY